MALDQNDLDQIRSMVRSMIPLQTSEGPPPLKSSLLIPAHPIIGREEYATSLYNAYKDVDLSRARLDVRGERHGVNFDKALDTVLAISVANLGIASDTEETENAQTVSPGRTGTPEAAIDAIGTANAQTAGNIANLSTAILPILAAQAGLAVSPTQLAQAVLAAVTAVQPRPTAATA